MARERRAAGREAPGTGTVPGASRPAARRELPALLLLRLVLGDDLGGALVEGVAAAAAADVVGLAHVADLHRAQAAGHHALGLLGTRLDAEGHALLRH